MQYSLTYIPQNYIAVLVPLSGQRVKRSLCFITGVVIITFKTHNKDLCGLCGLSLVFLCLCPSAPSCSWRSRVSPCVRLRGPSNRRCVSICSGSFSMCSSWLYWEELSTWSTLPQSYHWRRWDTAAEHQILVHCVLELVNRFSCLTLWAVSLRQNTIGWSIWSSSTFLPSPLASLTCSSLTCSARSHPLKTTPTPRRSMSHWWGKGGTWK